MSRNRIKSTIKITMVEPKAPNIHIWSKFKLPRLGPLLLGTIAKEAGYDVVVMYEEATGLDWNRLLSSHVVGISTITSTAPRAYEIADKLRSHGITVIMGGAHPTYMPEEALNHCDYVLRGEADETFLPLLDALDAGTDPRSIPGLSYKSGDDAVHNPKPELVRNLDSLPMPDMSLAHNPSSSTFRQGKVIPVLTSRGCPYDCAFCSVTGMFGRKYRFRSTASVMEELRNRDLVGNHVFFYDDNFTANPKRTKELLRAMIKAGITPDWSTQVHTDCARDPELLDLMKASGCNTLYIGLESINPATLKLYNKKQTVEKMERAIAAIHERGINVHGMFVFGGDADTGDTIRKTADWAVAQGMATVQFLILTPLPGTRTFRELTDQGRIILKDWSLYDTHHVVFMPKLMSPHELQVETYRAQGRFYSFEQVVSMLAKGDLINAAIRFYAGRMNKRWQKMNQDFIRFTKFMGRTG